jgi:hypothetical protein
LQLYASLATFAAELMLPALGGSMLLITAASNVTATNTNNNPIVSLLPTSNGANGSGDFFSEVHAAAPAGDSSSFWLVPAAEVDSAAAAGLVPVLPQRQQQLQQDLQQAEARNSQ